MRRTLNSFLKMIEQDESNSLLILVATNHPEILDHAVFRRFDDVIEYELPTSEQAVATLKGRLVDFADASFRWRSLGETSQSLNYADLPRAADEAIKDASFTTAPK